MSLASKNPLLNKYNKIIHSLNEAERIAVIHHWDTDGIASAVIIAKLLSFKDVLFHVPCIGAYSSKAVNAKNVRSFEPDIAVVLDYGISMREINSLKRNINTDIVVIDHHLTNVRGEMVCNPVAMGYNEEQFPSTTWVLKELFQIECMKDLIALGIVGDYGRYLENTIWLERVGRMINEKGLSIQDLQKAVQLIDSCYRAGDYLCINHAREILKEGDIRDIINNAIFHEKLKCIDEEIREVMLNIEPIKENKLMKVFRVITRNYITSYLGRELAYMYKDQIIVLVHYVSALDRVYIYVRSYKYDLSKVLMLLKDKGLNVGGKNHVLVVSCRLVDCNRLERLVLNTLIKSFNGD